jgi:hypothetical protein
VTAVPVEGANGLTIAAGAMGACAVLTPHGLLDSSTYLSLRDRIIKAALEEPEAVIIDVGDLSVPAESAWAVFTSARWHVDVWPEVPIMLVCEHLAGRSAIARNGVARYIPVHATSTWPGVRPSPATASRGTSRCMRPCRRPCSQ